MEEAQSAPARRRRADGVPTSTYLRVAAVAARSVSSRRDAATLAHWRRSGGEDAAVHKSHAPCGRPPSAAPAGGRNHPSSWPTCAGVSADQIG